MYTFLMPGKRYGTNHPQLKQRTRAPRVSHACAVYVTRVCCACHTRGILLLRLHTRANLMMDTQ